MSRSNLATAAESPIVWFEHARELDRSGNLAEAGRVIDSASSRERDLPEEAVLLRARLHLINDPSRAIGYLTENFARLHDRDRQVQALSLLASAHGKVGDQRNLRATWKRICTLIDASGGPRQRRADLAYYEAKVLWAQEKTAEARRKIALALASGPSRTYVETLILKGAVHAGSGEYQTQATVLLEALRATLSDRRPDVWKWATVTAQLCQLARDLPDRSIRGAALENVDRVPWTPDLSRRHSWALRSVAWRYAKEGDHFSAFTYLRKAQILADAPANRIVIACDRAYFADALGEWRWAEQEIEEAHDLIKSVDWGHVNDDERFALLKLAEACAPYDGTRAQSYLSRFQALEPEALSSGELRARAVKAYTLAHIHQLLNEFSEAEKLYKQAFDFYDGVGFDWPAGRTAIGLANLAKEPESARWRKIARAKLEHYPLSWLTEQVKRLEGTSSIPLVRVKRRSKTGSPTDLSPAQHEVYELLLRGLSAREVAKELGRSVFTIRNHMKALFKKLGVKSRATLMATAFDLRR